MSKPITCKICDLGEAIVNEHGDPADMDSSLHKGFTIGNGKKLYWYIIWHKSGHCTVFRTGDKQGAPLIPRYLKGDQLITVHFK